ncbi:unnamed protein product [Pocillopora meandrina]|uniref:G-protein coupled receptors family 1 profile domain-containing protein n=1 Tax=Pocillopora meandrina TaxID=46732 RepID=A0AAU9Y1M6_9CNID|nr:unnamed protein product [Pocillopora meandrina]
MSVVQEHWSLCRYARDAAHITANVLFLVSLMTTPAISVDRLLALLLGLRYKQIVTLRRTYIIVTTFWVFTLVASLYSRIAPWFGRIIISCCLLISIASYAKIFCALRRHHAQIQSHVQQQPSQPNALNMARYKKAVYSALWVQLVLLACYVPVILVGIVMAHIKGNSSHLVVALGIASTLVYFNSTLNPFLYCWKISEVRRAVKKTIRQALCCPRVGPVQEKGNDYRTMLATKFTGGGTQTKTFEILLCTPSFGGGLHQRFTFFSAVHILLSITAFLTNSLILVALHKESSLHRPSKLLYRSLATTDLLVGLVAQPLYATYWMSLVQEHWSLCRYAFDALYIMGSALFLVSLMTMTAISVDRLLALLLGLRYKQIVTLKRTYIIVATIWILAIVSSLWALLDDRIILLHRLITTPLCLLISLASYTKIFRTLRYHQVQAEDPVQQQPSQLNVLNIAQYRKAVYSALWVQLALVVCFAPFFIVVTAIAHSNKTHSSHLVILWGIADVLVYFNSTLNPFLYCWRISEVRQAMKQTIRQALCSDDRIMLISNFSSGRSHTKSYEELICSPSLMGGHQQLSICFLAVYILLSITAFAGNSLILVALYKESSLHPPSKLLYRCLATTDLLVGLVAQPLYATYWMSVFQEHWSRCRYARDAGYVTSHVLILVSLMTMTAISVDRLLALFLGLRYKQIVTLKRTYIIVTTFWFLTLSPLYVEFFIPV